MKLILTCESTVFGETIHVRVKDLGEEHEIEGGTALSYTENFTLRIRIYWRGVAIVQCVIVIQGLFIICITVFSSQTDVSKFFVLTYAN
jgi:hypothetical protein